MTPEEFKKRDDTKRIECPCCPGVTLLYMHCYSCERQWTQKQIDCPPLFIRVGEIIRKAFKS